MKPFHLWIESMSNSIEDASIIVKDEHGEIIEQSPVNIDEIEGKYSKDYPFAKISDNTWSKAQKHTYEAWIRRFDDEPTYTQDDCDEYD